ncbi:hypothetical protein RDWZM_004403 [Blomia tropicalis]|uniref:Uncharacterized protein n=1 Tax=Blomia tropicalis TaxID=40697 RepID=A0A9Q0MH22_BLOTA|nr:hypothetical protein RDWZM_004403 [Blomia tropicalis]
MKTLTAIMFSLVQLNVTKTARIIWIDCIMFIEQLVENGDRWTLSDKVEDSSASVVKTSETVEPKVGQLEVHVEEKASPVHILAHKHQHMPIVIEENHEVNKPESVVEFAPHQYDEHQYLHSMIHSQNAPLAAIPLLGSLAVSSFTTMLTLTGLGRRRRRRNVILHDDVMDHLNLRNQSFPVYQLDPNNSTEGGLSMNSSKFESSQSFPNGLNIFGNIKSSDDQLKPPNPISELFQLDVVQQYLRQSGRPDYNDQIIASYLACRGLFSTGNHCLERLACHYADIHNGRLKPLERDVAALIIYSLLRNSHIDSTFKRRLQRAALFGYDHIAEQSSSSSSSSTSSSFESSFVPICDREFPCPKISSSTSSLNHICFDNNETNSRLMNHRLEHTDHVNLSEPIQRSDNDHFTSESRVKNDIIPLHYVVKTSPDKLNNRPRIQKATKYIVATSDNRNRNKKPMFIPVAAYSVTKRRPKNKERNKQCQDNKCLEHRRCPHQAYHRAVYGYIHKPEVIEFRGQYYYGNNDHSVSNQEPDHEQQMSTKYKAHVEYDGHDSMGAYPHERHRVSYVPMETYHEEHSASAFLLAKLKKALLLKGITAKGLLLASLPLMLTPVISYLLTPVVIPITATVAAGRRKRNVANQNFWSGNGTFSIIHGSNGSKSIDSTNEIEDRKIRDAKILLEYLKKVKPDERLTTSAVANFLECDGLLLKSDRCLEQLSCEFSDIRNANAVRLERAVTSMLLVGAPLAKTDQPNVIQGGAVYQCSIDSFNTCQQIPFDRTGSSIIKIRGRDMQEDEKSHQWFGATLASAAEGPIVACAPRFVYFTTTLARKDPIGNCFVSRGSFTGFLQYSPCRNNFWGYHRQGSCQAGMSAAVSKDGKRLYVGAPGSWYWQGQAFSHDLEHDISMSTNKAPPYDDDSFLGYSLTVGRFSSSNDYDVAVGMPKGNNYTGKVVVFTSTLQNVANISGEQMGSYFGYSMTTADVNGDR